MNVCPLLPWGRQASFLCGSLNNGADPLGSIAPALAEAHFSACPAVVLATTSWLTPRSPWQQCKMGSAHMTSLSPAMVSSGGGSALGGEKRGLGMIPFSFSTRSLHFLSRRGAPCLAAPLWQCVLPPGGSAFLHDPADCKWPPQGAGEGPRSGREPGEGSGELGHLGIRTEKSRSGWEGHGKIGGGAGRGRFFMEGWEEGCWEVRFTQETLSLYAASWGAAGLGTSARSPERHEPLLLPAA